jgi:cell division septum initiation protein DivIVA
MLNFIRTALGLDLIVKVLTRTANDTQLLKAKIYSLEAEIHNIHGAVGRILALIDPNFSRDELSPAVRAESDEISRRAMAKIHTEQAARDHTTGTIR